MLFSSPAFVEQFLPIILIIFYFFDYKRPGFLIVALLASSLYFCAQNGYSQFIVLVFSIFFNFFASVIICGKQTNVIRLNALIGGIVLNLILLGYFKYAGFIIFNINQLFGSNYYIPSHELPVGISFYTFTQIAFLVDLYKGNGPNNLKLPNYALFVTYFPHVVAGPIIHWKEMMIQFDELVNTRCFLLELAEYRNKLCSGVMLFGIGLSKKVLIADQLSLIADRGYQFSYNIGFLESWITSLSYTFQLYFDFSGYSDMAIGISLLFGISLPVNFNAPYQATSIQDFWRRWHITLSRWLREYVYFPLGGNKHGRIITLRNLIITFLLGGVWHGASWTFIVWGALHGLACSLNHLWSNQKYNLPRSTAMILTFLFVDITWVFFRSPDLSSAMAILSAMVNPFHSSSVLPKQQYPFILLSILIIWLAPTSQKIAFDTKPYLMPAGGFIVGVLIFISILSQNNAPSSPFLYFNF